MHLQQNGAVSSSQHEEGRSRAFMGSGYSLSGDSSAPVERNEEVVEWWNDLEDDEAGRDGAQADS